MFCVCCRELPSYKQRIAGKSIPMEKFVIKKSERFFAQNDRLCLPVLELLYIWNYLKIIGKKLTMVENFYHLIERTMEDLERRKQGDYLIRFEFTCYYEAHRLNGFWERRKLVSHLLTQFNLQKNTMQMILRWCFFSEAVVYDP